MSSSNSHASVSGVFVIDQVAGAVARGHNAEALLQEAGIDSEILQNPHQRVSFKAFANLMRETWDALGDESSGYMAQPLKLGSFAMMCHATITCPNLRRALMRSARCFNLYTDALHFELLEQGEEAQVNITLKPQPGLDNRYFYESLLLIWARWASWLIDKKILLSRINFSFPKPAHVVEYDSLFTCEHYFDQPVTSLVIPARYLDMPLAQDPQTLTNFLANSPGNLLTHYKKDDSLSAQVRHLLYHSNVVENLSLEEASSHLHLTSQTLRRRLKEEGNSFQEIKDGVRRDTASFHLLRGEMSINDIAQLMGFSEPSVFHRAFKKWTGFTPGAYRDAHQK